MNNRIGVPAMSPCAPPPPHAVVLGAGYSGVVQLTRADDTPWAGSVLTRGAGRLAAGR